MRIPLRFITLAAILGDQESGESLPMANAFSSGGSRNLWIDKLGRASMIEGYARQNAAAVTSNTGANATRLRTLYPYAYRTGGVLTRQLIGIFDDATAHWEFRKSTNVGVNWTFVSDLGAASINAIPDFAQAGNVLVMVNGVVAAQTWDGTSLAAATTTQIAAPTIASAGAGQKNGKYYARVVPIKSDGSRKSASVTSLAFDAQLKRLTITWNRDTPTDPTVTAYEIYLTTGTGRTFFFEGLAPDAGSGVTQSFEANTADADIIGNRVLAEYGDAPPVGCAFCEMHQGIMWYASTATYPRRGWYADPGLPVSTYPDEHYIDFTDGESFSDISTGMTGDYQKMLVYWLERSIWTVSGDGDTTGVVVNYHRDRSNARMGTVSHRTVARIPRGALYIDEQGERHATDQVMLAYLTPVGDIRLFDGDNDTVISGPKQDTVARLSYVARAKSHVLVDTVRSEVAWIFAVDGETEPTIAVVWNYRFGVWYERTWPFASGVAIDTADDANVLLAGEVDRAIGGFCYLLWDGLNFVTTPMDVRWMSKTFYAEPDGRTDAGPMIQHTVRWRWVEFLLHLSGAMELVVDWFSGEVPNEAQVVGTAIIGVGSSSQVPTVTIQTSDGSDLQTIEGSDIVAGGPITIRVKLQTNGKYLHSRGMRVRLSSESADASWMLVGMKVAYQLLPGLKRPFIR